MSHILHHELTRIAHDMVDEAITELRRGAARQAEARVRELRRSILGTEHGGVLCGDTIRVRPPSAMARLAASTEPQEAS